MEIIINIGMGDVMKDRYEFKFRYVNGDFWKNIFSSPADLNRDIFRLDGKDLPLKNIVCSSGLGNRLLLYVDQLLQFDSEISKNVKEDRLELYIYGMPATEIANSLNQNCSKIQFKKRLADLHEEGKQEHARSIQCPDCKSTIDLTFYEESKYTYCYYCQAIFKDRMEPEVPNNYRICIDCGFFGRISEHHEFYFLFLLVVYYFSYNKKLACDKCAHSIFVKTLLTNLIFFLGVPVSIYTKFKSLKGREKGLEDLPKANAFAEKGKLNQAMDLYRNIEKIHPEHPGILMNQGLAYMFANKPQQAMEKFDHAIRICSNYEPAIRKKAYALKPETSLAELAEPEKKRVEPGNFGR
ncbi:MAG: tetratricopeptide repeat protein [Vulcanimicrobiota bacterium]